METRFAFVSVVIFTTLGETRFTTEEKLPYSRAPRLTSWRSRLTSTEAFALTLAAGTLESVRAVTFDDCAPAANAPARASTPAAQRPFRRLNREVCVFMVFKIWAEDATPG